MISSRIRRLVQQQWAGLIALFLVLTGGSAWALDGSNTVFSDDIVDKQVKTADIEAAAVTNGKLAPDAVNSAKIAGGGVTTDDLADAAVAQAKLGPDSVNSRKVADNSLKGADIDESTLSSIGGGGPAGGDLTGTYPNPQIAAGAVGSAEVAGNSLTGDDIDESTMGQVPSALLGGFGRSASGGECDPDEPAFLTCAFTTVNLPAPTRVLVIGTVKPQPEPGGSSGTGQCRLATNLGTITESGFTVHSTPNTFVPLIGTTIVGAGPMDFGIECNELDLDLTYFDARVAAVALSPG